MENNYTNMLIIGNGFDLAHERPTTYSDFLLFLKLIQEIRNCSKDRTDIEEYLNVEYSKLCPTVREYILSSLDTRMDTEGGYVKNRNAMIQELYDCLDKNVWYEYFQLRNCYELTFQSVALKRLQRPELCGKIANLFFNSS